MTKKPIRATRSNLRALQPAVAEVNQLADFMIAIDPIKTGRKVTHVDMRWWRKDADGVGASARELSFSKVGRKERAAQGAAAPHRARPEHMDRKGPALLTETYQTARLRFPGYDIYYVESEWRSWVKTKEAPRDPDRAYLAFFATFAKSHPI